jgi:hypothetical protein
MERPFSVAAGDANGHLRASAVRGARSRLMSICNLDFGPVSSLASTSASVNLASRILQ